MAMKKKGYAKGGAMKKKGYAKGGAMKKKPIAMKKGSKLRMVEKDGKKVPFFAADGVGSNGLFTEKLLKHITTPGLTLERVFKQVRMDVQQASNSRQVPWDSSSVTGDFFFVPPVAAPPAVTLLELDDLQGEARAAERERLKEQQRLQQVSRERQRIKTQWQAWQQRMEKDYDKVAAFEQQSIGNLLKIES